MMGYAVNTATGSIQLNLLLEPSLRKEVSTNLPKQVNFVQYPMVAQMKLLATMTAKQSMKMAPA